MRNLGLVALLGLSTGCSVLGVQWEGVWFVEMPLMDPSACDFGGDENYQNAEFPDVDVPVDGPWTYTDEGEFSPSAFMIQIMKGKKGEMFVVIGDRVFPAIADSKTLIASWEGITDDAHTEEHEAGYDFTETILNHTNETITLSKVGPEFKGVWDIESTASTSWTETDQWKQAQVGLTYSQIPSTFYLTGAGRDNVPLDKDCNGDCELTLTTNCAGKVDFTVSYAGNYDGMYDAVEDASQAPGSSGGGYYYYNPYDTTWYY
jgi:hypothetical protein